MLLPISQEPDNRWNWNVWFESNPLLRFPIDLAYVLAVVAEAAVVVVAVVEAVAAAEMVVAAAEKAVAVVPAEKVAVVEAVAAAEKVVVAAVVEVEAPAESLAAAEVLRLILLPCPSEAQLIRALALVARSDSFCTSVLLAGLYGPGSCAPRARSTLDPFMNDLISTQYITKPLRHERLLYATIQQSCFFTR